MHPSPERPTRTLRWVPWLLLAVGLALSALAASQFDQAAAARDQLRFRTAAFEAEAGIKARVEAQLALLRGAAGLFSASDRVDRAAFASYVASLELPEHYPGAQGLGFARAFPCASAAEAEAKARDDGAGGLRAWPRRDEALCSMIELVEPLDLRNQAALGFDMLSEPTRRKAMEAARDAGRAIASAKVTLVQEIDEDKQPGFLIYEPVYQRGGPVGTEADRRASIEGWVYSPFRAHDLLGAALGPAQQSLLSVAIFDGATTAPEALLFSKGDRARGESSPMIRPIAAAGRPWTVEFRPGSRLDDESTRGLTWVVLGAGVAASIGLFGLSKLQLEAGVTAARVARDLARMRDEALQATARAEEASRLKDDFLATLSHELRTPLNALMGWVQLVQSGVVEGDDREKALETIARNGRALARLVDDLLDVSRIVTGKMRLQIEQVDGGSVIEAAVEALRPTARIKQVELSTSVSDELGRFGADPARLQQVVWNLVSNAVKFTPPGGRVSVRAERQGDWVAIEVSDTGKGMTSTFVPHAFDRFRQADPSATRSQGGLGLGLSIVRHLVELHGGAVRVESEGEGKGATFTVTIPASSAQPSLGPLPASGPVAAASRRGA